MKQKIVICVVTIGTLAILILQGFWLMNMYTQYRKDVSEQMLSKYQLAIELELGMRSSAKAKEQMYEFTPKKVIPTKKLHEYTGDTIKLTDAIQQNVGNNFAEIFSQIYQTVLITKGKFININDLDSIYEQELKKQKLQTQHVFILYNNEGRCISFSGDTLQFVGNTHILSAIQPIGAKSLQSLKLLVNLPPNLILDRMASALIISFLLAILIIACLLYQLIIIRRRDNLLYKRTAAINGVIHDLKSPLNATHAILLYFAQVEENKDKLELLKSGKARIERLGNIIESLLLVAKSQKQEIVINKKEINIIQIIYKVIEDIKLCFINKQFNIKVNNHLKETNIYVDEIGISSVFTNLIENALKYSDNNTQIDITLSASLSELYIDISDDGYGIPAKEHKKIFNQFYQTPNSRKNDGYGIGLAYIKKIIEAHHGSISLKNNPQKGTTFLIKLPIN